MSLLSRATRSKSLRLIAGLSLFASGVSQTRLVSAAPATVTGSVFLDFGADGTRGTTGTQVDRGIGGITVTAYGDGGAACGSATTAADGSYSISHTCSTSTVRIEATWDESDSRFLGIKPSIHGANNASTVQFVADNATNVDIAVLRPSDYCGTNPRLAVSCFLNGSATNDLATAKSVSRFDWAASGDGRGAVNRFAQRQDTGAVWGIASSRKTGDVYSAAVLRRHIGLGSGGLGQIYRTTAAGVTTPFLNVGSSVGTIDEASRGLGASTVPVFDDEAFARVAKAGIGDLDLNDSESLFYLANLATREIVSTPVATSANLVSYGTPPLACTAPAVARVWGLEVRSFQVNGVQIDRVYAGATCDGASNAINAGVFSRDVNAASQAALTTWASVVDVAPYTSAGTWGTGGVAWQQWSDSLNRKSMLISDIDFDANGDMTIGVMDRSGLQMSANNYNAPGELPRNNNVPYAGVSGDTLKACPNTSGAYVLESGGACGGIQTAGTGADHRGPGGGEFYFRDDFNGGTAVANSAGGHPEVSGGSLAVLPGSNLVASSAWDPNEWLTSGVRWFDQTTGGRSRDYMLQGSGASTDPSNRDPGGLGKAAGIGDVELLCDKAPFEVGNRVWVDADTDGVQDATEPGIGGVRVELYAPNGTPLGSTVTAADGTYYFSSRDIAGLTEETANYEIRIPANQVPLTNHVTSTTNADASAGGDLRDSDGQRITSTTNGSSYTFSTGTAGSTDHTMDFGFVPQYSLGNRVWMDTDNNGLIDTGELGVDGVVVTLIDSNGVPVGTATTANGGYYRFDNLLAGNYRVRIDGSNFGAGAPLEGKLSSATTEANPNVDRDSNDNGIDPALPGDYVTAGVSSGVVTLGGSAEPTNDTDANPSNPAGESPNSRSNRTVDFGFYMVVVPPTTTSTTTSTTTTSTTTTVPTTTSTTTTIAPTTSTTTSTTTTVPTSTSTTTSTTIEPTTTSTVPATTSTTTTLDPTTTTTTTTLPTTTSSTSTSTSTTTTTTTTTTIPATTSTTTTSTTVPAPTTTSTVPPTTVVTPETYSLGNRIWMDTDGDGIIDSTEMGVDGVVVTLLDGSGNAIASATTANGGYYRFDGLAAGDYRVRVAAANFAAGGALAGKVSSTPTEADPNGDVDGNDNGINPAAPTDAVLSGVVTLGGSAEPTNDPGSDPTNPVGEAPDNRSNRTVDFGFTTPPVIGETYSLGNRVWMDNNNNGRIDTNEMGVDGVVVSLINSSGNVVASATTANGGYYRFDGLAAGDYRVRIDASNFATGGALAGKLSSTPTETDPNVDGESNDNGIDPASTTDYTTAGVASGVITLGGNNEPTTDADRNPANPAGEAPDTRSNLTVDFGFATPVVAPTASTVPPIFASPVTVAPVTTVAVTVPASTVPGSTVPGSTVPPKTGGVRSVVFVDSNGDGVKSVDEAPVAGAVVEIRNTKGEVVARATTDANGAYEVNNLPVGEYEVVVSNVPAGYEFLTVKNVKVQVLSDQIVTAEFRVNIEISSTIAFTGSSSNDMSAGAILLIGSGVVLMGLSRPRRRRALHS